MENFVLIGNLISGIGVFFLLLGHYIISTGKEIKGIKFSITGSFFVSIGAILLTSWPILGLNAFWIMIGLYGLYHRKNNENIEKKTSRSSYVNYFFLVLFLTGMAFSLSGQYDIAAWFCTVLYLSAFALFSNKYITNFEYMIWTFLGFFLLLEHLILKYNYSVLFNETIGALISFNGIILCLKNKKKVEPS